MNHKPFRRPRLKRAKEAQAQPRKLTYRSLISETTRILTLNCRAYSCKCLNESLLQRLNLGECPFIGADCYDVTKEMWENFLLSHTEEEPKRKDTQKNEPPQEATLPKDTAAKENFLATVSDTLCKGCHQPIGFCPRNLLIRVAEHDGLCPFLAKDKSCKTVTKEDWKDFLTQLIEEF